MSNLIELQKRFVNYRLGQFIHFNSATFQFNNTEMMDWEYGVENNNEPRKFPFNEKDWNPYKLDCKQWAKASKSMGAKFAALTTKHHEGFCLWPTKTTEHCIRNATLTKDVVGEYLEAYRSEGIAAGIYFSILDLTRGIGRKRCNKEDVEYTKEQFYELLTGYGEIPFIIIDGWEAHWGGPSYKDLPFEELDAFVKSIQPNCLLNNHSCETSLAHTDIVFYENAAGQQIADGFNGPGCSGNILTNGNWFWRERDSVSELKSAKWALDKINDANSRNVSFLLNASPNKYGLIDDNMAARFEEIGRSFNPPCDLVEIPHNWMTR